MSRLARRFERAIESLHLPAMPSSLLRFQEEAASDAASPDILAELALLDPALTARVLAASHAGGPANGAQWRRLRDCLESLGLARVRTIVACLFVQAALPCAKGAEAFDHDSFRRHALRVAELARELAAELEVSEAEREEAYVAGLLHDIGQPMLLGGLGGFYGELLVDAGSEQALSERETELLSVDHAEAAAWLVDQWGLPSLMADAIQFHHLPHEATRGLDRLGRLLWSAHALEAADGAVDAAAVGTLLGLRAERVQARVEQALARAEGLLRGGAAVDALAPGSLAPAFVVPLALQSVTRDLAGFADETALLECLGDAARILFGLQRLCFLLEAPDRPVLAVSPAGAPGAALARLRIPLQGAACLCLEAATHGLLAVSHDHAPPETLPPMDRQLAMALGAEGVIYAPLLASGATLGVLALGASPVQRQRLGEQTGRLREFAAAGARLLAAWRAQRERARQVEAEAAARQALRGQRVAHEVSNPLAIIQNYLQLIAGDAQGADGGRTQADIDVLREEIDRLGRLVRDLATEAATEASAPATEDVDLRVLLEGLRHLYGPALFGDRGMHLELQLPRGPARVRADPDRIRQVVFNLWKNASQAMAGTGTVVTELEPRVDHNGARFAQIRIRDSGPGLPQAVLDSLYQPRERGAADPLRPADRAGLGLSIVLALVKDLRGAITCVSRPGDGTSFSVLIPES